MKNKYIKKNNNNYFVILSSIVLFIILSLTIGYSAFSKELFVDNIVATVIPDFAVRVTSFNFNKSTNGGQSNNSYYDNTTLSADLVLPNSDSTVTYEVAAKNYGNVEMGIQSISLPPELDDILDISIEGYELDTKLRDDVDSCETSSSGCKLAIDRTFYITVKYAPGAYDSSKTTFNNFSLDFNFVQAFKVTYTGFTLTNPASDMNSNSILDGSTFKKNIGEHQSLTVKINGDIQSADKYTIDDNNNLTIEKVYGDLEIIIEEIEYSVKLDVKNPDGVAEIKYIINNGAEQTVEDSLDIKVKKGSSLKINVSAKGNSIYYKDYNETFDNIIADIIKEISLESYHTVLIKAIPEDANIEYTINNTTKNVTGILSSEYSTNTIIDVTVSKSGYKTENKTYTVTSNIEDTITLTKLYTLTLNSNPADAQIFVDYGEGEKQVSNGFSIELLPNTDISVYAKRDGYIQSEKETFKLANDLNKTITLTKLYTFTVKEKNNVSSNITLTSNYANNSCSSATTCSVSVPAGTSVTYSFKADYHVDQSASAIVNSDSSVDITMQQKGEQTVEYGPNSASRSSSMIFNIDNAVDDYNNTDSSTHGSITSSSRAVTWTFNANTSIPADGKVTSVEVKYKVGATLSSKGTATMAIGGSTCATSSYSVSSMDGKVFSISCSSTASTLRSNSITLKAEFSKTSLAEAYWYGAGVIVHYIPK